MKSNMTFEVISRNETHTRFKVWDSESSEGTQALCGEVCMLTVNFEALWRALGMGIEGNYAGTTKYTKQFRH